MSEVAKITMPVAVGLPSNASAVSKVVMYVAFSNVPTVPVRRKVMGRIRYGDAGNP